MGIGGSTLVEGTWPRAGCSGYPQVLAQAIARRPDVFVIQHGKARLPQVAERLILCRLKSTFLSNQSWIFPYSIYGPPGAISRS